MNTDLSFGKSELNEEIGPTKEWLLTNGLGGFASSTIIGLNTRRYHGLLVASFRPPVNRRLLVAKLDEDVYIDGERFVLGTNRVQEGYAQKGYQYLQRFQRNPLPTYTYQIEDLYILKTIMMVHGKNATVVHYKIVNNNNRRIELYLFPLVNCRDYHHTIRENDWPFKQEIKANAHQVEIEPYPGAPHITLASDLATYTMETSWYRGMYYAMEDFRGLPCYEDHFIPGYFKLQCNSSIEFSIAFSTEVLFPINYRALFTQESRRLEQLLEMAGYQDDFLRQLVLAADDFLVERKSTGKKTIIAGYPWFSDWGRDAMIALPGLTLCTGRYREAREILATFSEYVRDGLIPNMFPDAGQEPLYNTVDASMWFFFAVQKYLAYTKDYDFVKDHLYSTMRGIIGHYRDGTLFNIRMDEDGLISADYPGLQLTWMDAKVGDWVVTPRAGKPVEINALWYNALMFMADLSKLFGEEDAYSELAVRVAKGFNNSFWNEAGRCLYDVIGEEFKDDRIRPNQIFAVSLPYSPLDEVRSRHVVRRVWEELYAVYGLRSLSPLDPGFRGQYGGNQIERDAAYHQGTVWAWLIGHFITAYCKVFGRSPVSLLVVRLFLAPFRDHLRDHGVGSISEIFDGLPPFAPRGCFAQAWSVAEVLRCCVEELGPKVVTKLAGIFTSFV